MTDFSYRLVCLTHAAGGDTLPDALAAFEEHARPAPVEVVVVVDGPEFGYVTEALTGRFQNGSVQVHADHEQRGFCEATRRAWILGGEERWPNPPFVFYLEHDFLLTRTVYLGELAIVLNADPQLAQLALMRDAVNEQEIGAGGLFESRPGQYTRRSMNLRTGYVRKRPVPSGICLSINDLGWLEHRAYLTTNPSLMRRSFMQEHPWPAEYVDQCEGRFGIDLVAQGFSFGVWGTGEPWCTHAGVRKGFGY